MQALPNHLCPLCGQPNDCAPAGCGSLDVDCWCSKTSIDPQSLAQIPESQKNIACLCPKCAANPPTSL